jgi:hypothetical protein
MTDIAPAAAEPTHRGGHGVDLLDGEFTDATEHRVRVPEEHHEPPKTTRPERAKANGHLVLIRLPPRLPEGWDLDMSEAPDDGKPIWTLHVDRNGWLPIETVWRHTRYLFCGQWQQGGFWAVRNAGGTRLPSEPIAWRPA